MNRDEIIQLIAESIAEADGIDIKDVPPPPEHFEEDMPTVEIFANKLLQAGAAAEREECAKVCDRYGSSYFAEKIRQRGDYE